MLHEWNSMGQRLYCSQQYQGLSLASASIITSNIILHHLYNIIWGVPYREVPQNRCFVMENPFDWVAELNQFNAQCSESPASTGQWRNWWFAAKMDLTQQSNLTKEPLVPPRKDDTWAVTGCQHGSTAAGVQSNRCGTCWIQDDTIRSDRGYL